MMEELRRDARRPMELPVRFWGEGPHEPSLRESRDLSEGGVFIRCPRPLAEGQPLRFELHLEAGRVVRGSGRVAWSRRPDPRRRELPPGMGVAFVEIDEGREALGALLGGTPIHDERPRTIDAKRTLLGVMSPAMVAPAEPPAEPSTLRGVVSPAAAPSVVARAAAATLDAPTAQPPKDVRRTILGMPSPSFAPPELAPERRLAELPHAAPISEPDRSVVPGPARPRRRTGAILLAVIFALAVAVAIAIRVAG